jgi:CTP synthase
MDDVSERHRHRYEFNREFEKTLSEHGLRLTGQTPDAVYVEICELPDHPWYLGCQFHPEFKSKPLEPHPLFTAFLGAALQHREQKSEARTNARVTTSEPSTQEFLHVQ